MQIGTRSQKHPRNGVDWIQCQQSGYLVLSICRIAMSNNFWFSFPKKSIVSNLGVPAYFIGGTREQEWQWFFDTGCVVGKGCRWIGNLRQGIFFHLLHRPKFVPGYRCKSWSFLMRKSSRRFPSSAISSSMLHGCADHHSGRESEKSK